ncbi:MAG: sugar ABC transporter permease [Clostridiales bacterium]|nr:sugar ABC transporter permease [Clostridiales bacterium]
MVQTGSRRSCVPRVRTALRSIRKKKAAYLMIAPYMLIFLTFTVVPVIVSMVLSLTKYDVLQSPEFIGLRNYTNLFINDEVFGIAVRNTIIFALVTGLVGYALSFFVAWAINELNKMLRALLTFIFYAPTISGTVYTIWSVIFNGDMYGYANSLLLRLNIISAPIEWFTTDAYILPMIIIVQLWMSMGAGFLTLRAGMSSVDGQLYEAGAIDGVKNRFQELWYITIPQMAPHMMTAAVLQITSMFASSAVSTTLAGFPSTNYAGHLVMTHLMDYSSYRLERGYACAIAVLLFLFMIAINQTVLKFLRKVGG